MFVSKATVGPGKSAIKPMLIFSSSISHLSNIPQFNHVVNTIVLYFIINKIVKIPFCDSRDTHNNWYIQTQNIFQYIHTIHLFLQLR